MAALLAIALVVTGLALPQGAGAVSSYEAATHLAGDIGSRPAGSRNERRAHRYVAGRFEAAGLTVSAERFRVPGRGTSRNVIGRIEGASNCLLVLMAHTDSVPPGPGANDNASGVGVLVGLAPRLAVLKPQCDVWLVATGAEERVVIGTGYHVGAAALVKTVKNEGRGGDLRFALSVDMVGRGRRFYLRSPEAGVRDAVEGQILAAARRAGVTVRWARDSGSGNSDHREFELAGLPAAVIQVWRGSDPCHHEACDRPGRLQKRALNRALRVAQEVVRG
ncbi:MAG: M28 family metallopeptidase [Solirubrobacterales bacterium]